MLSKLATHDPEGVRLTDPGDIGYWTRAQGLPRPVYAVEHYGNGTFERQIIAGWDECDREITAESAR